MPPSPDRELLPMTAARQLLERAGEIDADSTTVDTLRTAAREAGISEAAFEAALVEMRGKMAVQAKAEPPRRSMKRLVFGLVAAATLLAATVFVVIPRAVESAESDMLSHEFIVQCLPMNQAADLARTILGPDNEIRMSPGSRYLRVRATAAQMKDLTSKLAAAAKGASCDITGR